MGRRIKVLVVDDSALVREVLSQGLALDPDIEVVGQASDPYMARDQILKLKPDVLTLDVEMPLMNGVEFLRRLMPQHPIPVLMVSALTERGKKVTLDALEAGAVDFVTKPSIDIARGLNDMLRELHAKIKVVAAANVSGWKRDQTRVSRDPCNTGNYPTTADWRNKNCMDPDLHSKKIVAIGASTGGTEAIRYIISQFPANMPCLLIVQHMPPGFTAMFAERLNAQSEMTVREAGNGDYLPQGTALVAPGDFHVEIRRADSAYRVYLNQDEKVCGHRPSVDVLFNSLARYVGPDAVGVILTGMGDDGARGMVAMRQAGARTIAQDEATSVVFGMPRMAYERGGTDRLLPIRDIPVAILNLLAERA